MRWACTELAGPGHDIGMGLLQQFRCPSGLMGRLAGTSMVATNTPLVRAVTAAVGAADGEHILDIGFGPGVSLLLLARAAPAAVLAGIDPSPVMLRLAGRRTARLASKPDLRLGTAAALPWPDGAFDAVSSTNSVQLWQPLPASLGEARRVLRPGGRLALGVHERAVLPAGGTAGRHFDEILVPALQAAGFADINARYQPTRGGRSAAGPSPRQGDGPAPARRTAAGGTPATGTGGTAGPRPRRGGAGPGAGAGLPRVARSAAGTPAPGQRLTILPIRPRLEDS